MQTPSDGYITEVNAGASGSGCHWALASNRPAHWFNRVTQFANVSIADDEPGMTALRPSSTYKPAFYGVTTSGTVSTGTRGPLGESIILADGASLAFTGAYEQVGVHHTQDAGQGSLAFAFNGGAAYKDCERCRCSGTRSIFRPVPDRAGGERKLYPDGRRRTCGDHRAYPSRHKGGRLAPASADAARRARKLYIRVLQRAAPCFCGRTMGLCWRQDRAGPRPGHQRQLWHAAGDDFNEHHVDHQHAGSGPGAANAPVLALGWQLYGRPNIRRSAWRDPPNLPGRAMCRRSRSTGSITSARGPIKKACTSTTPATTAMHCASSNTSRKGDKATPFAIQCKGKVIATLEEGEEWVIVGKKILPVQ